MTVAAVGSVRCSSWARTVGLDPGGTAGTYDGFLVVDLPLPWPRDVGEIDEVAEVSQLLARLPGDPPGGPRLRVQASVPPEDGRRRVAVYRREEGGRFRGFSGMAVEVDGGGVRSALEAALAGEGAPVVGRELLVCTHGRRDVCCGSLGTELHGLLAASPLPDDVHLARTSHTGGHRFAPTFILLPEGTVWAFADVELVLRVLSRRGGLPGAAEAADHYRGCAGLAGPRVQVLEREVLREVGWGLLSSARSGYETEDGLVRLEVEMGDGSGGERGGGDGSGGERVGGDGSGGGGEGGDGSGGERVGGDGSGGGSGGGGEGHGSGHGEDGVAGGLVEVWEAAVVPGRTLPVPDCGRPLEEAKKSETEWEVRDLRRV